MSKNLNFKPLKGNELFWQEEVVYCVVSRMPFTSFTLLGALKYCSPLLLIYYNYRCFWFMFRGILLQRVKLLGVEDSSWSYLRSSSETGWEPLIWLLAVPFSEHKREVALKLSVQVSGKQVSQSSNWCYQTVQMLAQGWLCKEQL